MSNIDKQALRKRYSAKPTPKCDICGAEMTIQRMSGSRVTYGCSGAIYDETGCHYAEGRSLADDHYEQSRLTVTDESDPDVLALLDELEAKETENERMARELLNRSGEIEGLRQRIAELESREINLPPYSFFDFKQGSPFKSGAYCHIDSVNKELSKHCIKMIAAAGKGE